jgi:hypothetical protein
VEAAAPETPESVAVPENTAEPLVAFAAAGADATQPEPVLV